MLFVPRKIIANSIKNTIALKEDNVDFSLSENEKEFTLQAKNFESLTTLEYYSEDNTSIYDYVKEPEEKILELIYQSNGM